MDIKLCQYHLLERLSFLHLFIFALLSKTSLLYLFINLSAIFVPLIYLSILSPISYCHYCCNFRVCLEVKSSVLWPCFTTSVLCWLLNYVTRAAVTKYQTGWLRIQIFIIVWFWRPGVQSQVPAAWSPLRPLALACQWAPFLLLLLVIFNLWRNSVGVSPDAMISSYKDTSQTGLGPTLKISFSLTYLMVLRRNLDTLRDTKDMCTQRRECEDVANRWPYVSYRE